MTIQISAVICTFNRASYLRKAIQSLVEQTLDVGRYEILVVDNRSTDDTKRVVTEEFSHIANLRYFYEPIQGLSQARNTGWQNATGEYVAYLDDDAIASPQWLETIVAVFETITPKPGGVGGKVEPIWEAPQPSWLDDNFLPFLTIVDWSDVATILDDKRRYIAGANMAFPKSVLALIQGFQVELGRKGNKLLSNEELILLNELKKKGYTIYYDPKILVKHHVVSSRLSQKWFTQRLYWQGVSNAFALRQQKTHTYSERIQLGIEEIKKVLEKPKDLKYLVRISTNKKEFKIRCSISQKLGYIYGLLTLI
jgi:glycosyltransferase involved in cell wall biosynthesis